MRIWGFGLTASSTVLRLVSAIAQVAILTRLTSFDMFGGIAVGLLYGQISAIFIDAGFNNELLRFAGTESSSAHNERLGESTRVRILAVPLVIGTALVYGIAAHGLLVGQALALAAGSAVLTTIADTYFVSLRSRRAFKQEFWQSGLQLGLLGPVALSVALIPWSAGPALLISRLAGLVLIAAAAGGAVRPLFEPPKLAAVVRYYRRLHYYFWDSAASNIGVRLDSIFISMFSGVSALAVYQPTSRLYYSGLSLASIVGGLSIPAAARRGLSGALSTLIMSFGLAGLIISVTIYLFLTVGVRYLFGEAFIPSILIAGSVSATLLIRYISAGLGAFLTLNGFQRARAISGMLITVGSAVVVLAIHLCIALSVAGILLILMLSQIALTCVYTVFILNILKDHSAVEK